MTVKLEDTASLLTEVTNVFTPEDDLKITEKFLGTQAEIKSATEKKQAEIKEIIRDWSQTVESLQERASFDSSKVEEQKRRIEEEKGAVIEQIQQMDEECRAIDAQTADVRVQSVGVAEQLNNCVENRDENLPQQQMKKNLYEMATNLKWDFNSDKIAGYVVKADIQELRPFEIDPAAKSRVQIADELWSTMS